MHRVSEFYPAKGEKCGLNRYCKECCKEEVRQNRRHQLETNREAFLAKTRATWAKHKHKRWATRILWKYGLTAEQYEQLKTRQLGACAICGETFSDNRKKVHIDHDHRTGVVRGILCEKCNRGIGHFCDDPLRLAAAILYLQGRRASDGGVRAEGT